MPTVWKFFTKKGNNKPKMYKTCGNTTNLAAHLKTKHHYAYLQFVNMQQKNSSESKKSDNENENASTDEDPSGDVPDVNIPSTSNHQIQEDSSEIKFFNQAVKNRKQVIQPTLVNCSERSLSFEEGGQKHSEVTQALIYMICKDNLPLSSVEKKGLQKFVRTICLLYKLPSRKKVTHLIQNRYNTTKEVIIKILNETIFICFTSDILTITNSTRSFLVLTVHFIDTINGSPDLQSLNLCAQQLSQGHTEQYIQECWKEICEEFKIDKTKIVSITTDGGANIVSAERLFLGDDHRIPCMAHCLNLVVDGVLRVINAFSVLCDHVKAIVTFFKQSVNAMDQFRAEQKSTGKKKKARC